MDSNSVFISYRRSTGAFIARAVFQDLRIHEIDVFMDVESIDSGQFASVILNQIAVRPYFLLILTPGTLDRCNEPNDWLRIEIEHAIDSKRIIVPLITSSFSFETAAPFLTGKLAQMQQFNAVDIPHNYFDEAMARLRQRFLKPVALSSIFVPDEDRSAIQRKLDQALTAPPITDKELEAQSYFEMALARAKDDLKGKIADYSAAIRLNPSFAQAYQNRGLAYYGQGYYGKALTDFSEVIRLDPSSSTAYSDRGFLYALQNKEDEALRDCNKAIRLNPNDSQAYLGRAIAIALVGNLDAAIADICEAISLEPDIGEVLDRMSFKSAEQDAMYQMGDLTAGLNFVRSAFNRGFGDIDGVIADLNDAIRVHPLIGWILAQVQQKRGKLT